MIHNANPTLIAQKMQGIAFAKVIETFPLWVGQMRHLGILAVRSELFDLVVVDEASQVNIAEIIPAFVARARICVVGDDKQRPQRGRGEHDYQPPVRGTHLNRSSTERLIRSGRCVCYL